MKGLLLKISLLAGIGSFAQSECDSTECSKYAALGTFEILSDDNPSESGNVQQVMLSCKMLCAIEEHRSQTEDVVFKYHPYTILIYRKELQIENVTE